MSFHFLFVVLLSASSAVSLPSLENVHVRQTNKSLPSPWAYVGCYTDSVDSRTIRTASTTSVSGMTIESCIAFCQPGGYQYVGLEFGRECYCDNFIRSPAVLTDNSNCNMPCSGDSTELCGAAGHVAVFSQAPKPIPAPWSYVGCYTDSISARTIRTASTTSVSGMTIESCFAFCDQGSYPYAGLEFGRECYCDTTIRNPGVAANDAECNMPCSGDSTELCGAASRVEIFFSSAPGTESSPSPSPSPSPSSPPPPPPVPTPQIKQTVSGTWQYRGCLRDIGERDLAHQINIVNATAELCVATCKANGYGLAGLEFGQECWCDNYLPYGQPLGDSACNMPCVGDPTEFCGAGNALQVYEDTSAVPLDPSQCISGRDSFTFGNVQLQAISKTGPYNPIQIYAATLNLESDDNTPEYTILSTCKTCPRNNTNYQLFNNIFIPYGLFDPKTFRPNIGDAQVFLEQGTLTSYAGYCAKPNPVSPTGPFIGFPVLSVDNRADLWALCTNTTAGGRIDVVYSPISNHPDYDIGGCQDVYLQMSQFYSFVS